MAKLPIKSVAQRKLDEALEKIKQKGGPRGIKKTKHPNRDHDRKGGENGRKRQDRGKE